MLRTAAASIARAAGWEAPAPDAAGVITFRLNEGLRLELFSPDGRTLILRGVVCSLPAEEGEADELVEKALRFAAAGGRRRSILSLPPLRQDRPDKQDKQEWADNAETARKLLLHRVLHGVEYSPTGNAALAGASGQARPAGDDFFAAEAQGLLNDLAWWRKHLGPETAPRTSDAAFSPYAGFPSPYAGGAWR